MDLTHIERPDCSIADRTPWEVAVDTMMGFQDLKDHGAGIVIGLNISLGIADVENLEQESADHQLLQHTQSSSCWPGQPSTS